MSLRSLYHGSGSTRFLGEYLSTRLKIRDFLDIPEHIVREYLTPKNYEKPKIEIGNYYLNWNHDSYGMQQKEVTELKLFLKNAITYFEIIFAVLNDLQKSRDLQKRRLSREFNPLVRILHNNKDHIVSLVAPSLTAVEIQLSAAWISQDSINCLNQRLSIAISGQG